MKRGAAPSIEMHRTDTIRRPPADVYEFWRDIANLAQLMDERVQVEARSRTKSHWTVRAPGRPLQWDAEIVADRPNRELAWQSVPGGDVDHEGSVSFEPAENGGATRATISFAVRPPPGLLGAMMGGMVRDVLEREIAALLERLKAKLEAAPR